MDLLVLSLVDLKVAWMVDLKALRMADAMAGERVVDWVVLSAKTQAESLAVMTVEV